MRVCVFTEPHRGATFDEMLRAAQHAEAAGYDGFFRADHFMPVNRSDGFPGPSDAWVTLGAIARETRTIRLGTLLTSATFRHPAITAVTVAQVDEMSNGRIDFGLGAGWLGAEHTALGIPFFTPRERFERLDEQLQIITGLWATPRGERFSFTGKHFTLVDALALPKPVQTPGPPVIVGGRGPKSTPRLAALHADEYNVPPSSAAKCAEQYDLVRAASEKYGRTKAPLVLSASVAVACGRTDAEIAQRLALLEEPSILPPEPVIAGTPDQVVEQLAAYAEAGATRLYVRLRDQSDLDLLDLLAAEVIPHLP
ncbi:MULTISPECIES: TIGR03560 family F420-dependent LLM class oxidoreductase [Catenuloplanes]|uniref:F420-dependent oxidoreductase-like protein n=1 Tax=Catenuloplanes niger TaxID=587534 RepID=A0AAE4CVJ1_9ACTN|nr:TIGR03560 family F420-dependent LLM class oxidoreductase [Catenuloplanes niger]MDR7322859.1 F420-dependent oxidoreductase-like protein [Catenuloplanes niger]